jgi:hypothetical protein
MDEHAKILSGTTCGNLTADLVQFLILLFVFVGLSFHEWAQAKIAQIECDWFKAQ